MLWPASFFLQKVFVCSINKLLCVSAFTLCCVYCWLMSSIKYDVKLEWGGKNHLSKLLSPNVSTCNVPSWTTLKLCIKFTLTIILLGFSLSCVSFTPRAQCFLIFKYLHSTNSVSHPILIYICFSWKKQCLRTK